MIDVPHVAVPEEQAAPRTLAALLLQQAGHTWDDTGVSAQPGAPVQPVPVEGTAGALHLRVPHDPRAVVAVQVQAPGRGPEGPVGPRYDGPVPAYHPTPRPPLVTPV